MGQFFCNACKKPLKLEAHVAIGRGDRCLHCGADLRSCLNCRHYDSNMRYECKESIQERVAEKDRGNFCDWFQPLLAGLAPTVGSALSSKEALLKAAEALFKK